MVGCGETAVNERSIKSPAWTLDQAREVYNIARWSGGYFDIYADGRLVVQSPHHDRHPGIVLATLATDLLDRGYGLPVLARFSHILHDRVDTLCEAFARAIANNTFSLSNPNLGCNSVTGKGISRIGVISVASDISALNFNCFGRRDSSTVVLIYSRP